MQHTCLLRLLAVTALVFVSGCVTTKLVETARKAKRSIDPWLYADAYLSNDALVLHYQEYQLVSSRGETVERWLLLELKDLRQSDRHKPPAVALDSNRVDSLLTIYKKVRIYRLRASTEKPPAACEVLFADTPKSPAILHLSCREPSEKLEIPPLAARRSYVAWWGYPIYILLPVAVGADVIGLPFNLVWIYQGLLDGVVVFP